MSYKIKRFMGEKEIECELALTFDNPITGEESTSPVEKPDIAAVLEELTNKKEQEITDSEIKENAMKFIASQKNVKAMIVILKSNDEDGSWDAHLEGDIKIHETIGLLEDLKYFYLSERDNILNDESIGA
jgi:hypothetical protein